MSRKYSEFTQEKHNETEYACDTAKERLILERWLEREKRIRDKIARAEKSKRQYLHTVTA